ncbi:MAG: Unknown protein [uncultured Thiotrichaceae bacterium]|uniref:Uncharacterized protein n=1 Tax=uncultured Thiotrichaceae bacterium TaxID=298394 RepID=A0A6S6S235_9GAMM|nr:MAG: Unknown protein [uncultured Thiotrichaceae bacterium]
MMMSAKAEVVLPDVKSFNRSLKNGAELTKITYKANLGHVLNEGSIPPKIKGDWNDRSALTSGLFPIQAGQRIHLSFMSKTLEDAETLPSLWYEVRYYDANGVFTEPGGGGLTVIEPTWKKITFDAKPATSAMKYAEVWFVKYQDEMPKEWLEKIEEKKTRNANIEEHLKETPKEETSEDGSEEEERGRNALLKLYTPENIEAITRPIYISDVSIR